MLIAGAVAGAVALGNCDVRRILARACRMLPLRRLDGDLFEAVARSGGPVRTRIGSDSPALRVMPLRIRKSSKPWKSRPRVFVDGGVGQPFDDQHGGDDGFSFDHGNAELDGFRCLARSKAAIMEGATFAAMRLLVAAPGGVSGSGPRIRISTDPPGGVDISRTR